MKNIAKVFIAVFAASSALALIFVFRGKFEPRTAATIQSKIVVPRQNETLKNTTDFKVENIENSAATTQIPLLPTETLFSVADFDLNNDSFDDQIIAVMPNLSENLSIIVGIYNQTNGAFERSAIFETQISQPQSLAFSFADLIGNHTNCAIASGLKKDGASEFTAILVESDIILTKIRKIAEISCDGSIFVEKKNRSQNYEHSMAKGESFQILALSQQSQNEQIQTIYDWNPLLQQYQKQETKILPIEIAEDSPAFQIDSLDLKERETMANGLWYLTSDTQNQMRCLFFDSAARELTFLETKSQEIFSWRHVSPRKNGIYFSIQNTEIPNLTRRCDVTFLSSDEIQVKVNDDVRMPISDDTLWTGIYRKQTSFNAQTESNESAVRLDELIKNEKKDVKWKSADGKILEISENRFTFSDDGFSTSGVIAVQQNASQTYIQFRPQQKTAILEGTFLMSLQDDDERQTLALKPTVRTGKGFVETDLPEMVFFRAQPQNQTPRE